MAFESLSDRLQETLKKVTGQATLTEASIITWYRNGDCRLL